MIRNRMRAIVAALALGLAGMVGLPGLFRGAPGAPGTTSWCWRKSWSAVRRLRRQEQVGQSITLRDSSGRPDRIRHEAAAALKQNTGKPCVGSKLR